jgi:hypothetical protein
MHTGRIFAGMATEEKADLKHTTQRRLADKSRWSNQDFAWVIAHLEATGHQPTIPAMPAKRAYRTKRLRDPLRTWPI